MSSASTQKRPNPDDARPAPVEFRHWPLVDERPLAAGLLGGATLLAIVVAVVVQSTAMTLLVVAVLAFALRWVWLPARYRLDSHGVTIQLGQRRRLVAWSSVARCRLTDGTLELHPRGSAAPRWLAVVVVPYGPDPAATVHLARRHLSPSALMAAGG